MSPSQRRRQNARQKKLVVKNTSSDKKARTPAPKTDRPIISRNVTPTEAHRAISRHAIALPVDMIQPRVRIAHTISHENLLMAPRIVFDHEMVLIHKGTGHFHYQDKTIKVTAGSLLLIEPFVSHSFDIPPQPNDVIVQHSAVHFDLAADKPAWAADIRRRPPYHIQLSHGLAFPLHTALPPNHPILNQLTDLIRTWHSPSPLGKLRASSLLLNILIQLLQGPAAHTSSTLHRHRPQMEKTIKHIQTHFANDMSLEDMAAIADLSRAHFVRLFTQWTGRPPGDYLQRTRIDHARTLLASPDDIPIKQIAIATGFKNPYHFSRVFRKYQGLSPSHFRQTLAGAPMDSQINTA